MENKWKFSNSLGFEFDETGDLKRRKKSVHKNARARVQEEDYHLEAKENRVPPGSQGELSPEKLCILDFSN